MSILVIVESPAKAKTIGNFLGKDYRVEASFGHVRDLPAKKRDVPEKYRKEKWAEFGVNTEEDFQPVYVISADKRKQITQLKKALKDSDGLLLATDEDREGESISWHLREVLDPKNKLDSQRIVFHEITREAIQEALANPRPLDDNLVRAQESRRILDRLYGYKLSPVLWRKVQPGLSAGRVQSVATRLIVEREEERRAFVSASYWDMEAEIGTGQGPFKATLVSVDNRRLASGKDFDPETGRMVNDKAFLLTENKATMMAGHLKEALPWTVKKVVDKPATQRPSPPFTTSTLQQEASRKLRFAAKRTMQIAQRLYEGIDLGGGERVGLITYMRTDSVALSKKALHDSQVAIRELYGEEYATGPRGYKTKQANAQEAHEAIRPTEVSRRPSDLKSYLSKEEMAVYELIWKKTIASQMPDAKLLRTQVEIAAYNSQGVEADFAASGKKILFPGFLRAYVEGSDDPTAEIGDKEVILPNLQEGQKVYPKGQADNDSGLFLVDLQTKGHETSPPARYTEASLVKKLEEESIGRPSTYASIISTIQDRGYVFENKQRQLIPTFTAMVVINLLRDHFPEYVDIKFTARMEEELDEIAQGDCEWVDHLRAFFKGTNSDPGLEAKVESKQKDIEFPTIFLGNDPESDAPIRVRVGKFGPYLQKGENGEGVMANIPKGTAPADLSMELALKLLAQREEGPRVVGTDPDTGLNVYATIGRFGAYVQLGETPEDKKAPKPKRASLEKGMDPDTVELNEALRLLSLPKDLGPHPDSGEPVMVSNGRFGPYVSHNGENRSLRKDDDPYTITLERAVELLAIPKRTRGGGAAAKTVLKELGEHEGVKIQVLDGRYGPYVTDGKVNATLPKNSDPEKVTMEQGLELLEAKKAAGPAKKRRATKKKS